MKNNIEIVLNTKIKLDPPPERGAVDLDAIQKLGVIATGAAVGVSARLLGLGHLLGDAARCAEEKAREEMLLNDINN